MLYNLTDGLISQFIAHYCNFTVTEEGAMLLSGDINKMNELFMNKNEDNDNNYSEEILKKYESFKLLVNLFIMSVDSLE